jgi:hypothetical protein
MTQVTLPTSARAIAAREMEKMMLRRIAGESWVRPQVRVSLCDTAIAGFYPALKGRATNRSSLRNWSMD